VGQRGEAVDLANQGVLMRRPRDDGLVEGHAGDAVGPRGHGGREVLGFDEVIEEVEPGNCRLGADLV
jgi:hypothetical protein